MAEPLRSGKHANAMRPRWRAAPFAPARIRLQATGGRGCFAALGIYRSARYAPRIVAALNAFSITSGLAPKRTPPFDGLDTLAKLGGIEPDAMSVMRSSHPDRFIVGFASGRDLTAVAKVGTDEDAGLRREAAALGVLRDWTGALTVPRLRWAGSWSGRFAIMSDAVERSGRVDHVDLETALNICLALAETVPNAPIVHGDLAPWNLLPVADKTAIIDWEESRFEDDPLYDLAHFVIQQGILLRRFTPSEAAEHLAAEGSVGWRYLEARGLDPRRARDFVVSYMKRTQAVTGSEGFEYRLAVARVLFP